MPTHNLNQLAIALVAAIVCIACASPSLAVTDLPDPLYQDTNGDGIDGDVSRAVFVYGATGTDAPSSGTRSTPCKTINYAIIRALNQGKTQVLIGKGIYSEKVGIANGVGLYGGYDGPPLWGRSTQSVTFIQWSASSGPDVFVIEAVGITSPTSVEALNIWADHAPPGESSYGVLAYQSPALILRHNTIRASNGGPGADGSNGSVGIGGRDGGDGGEAACVNLGAGTGGSFGITTCGPRGGQGGSGGLPFEGANDGEPGETAPLGGKGGLGGLSGSVGGDGQPGFKGADGANGPAGLLAPDGHLSEARWVPASPGGDGGYGVAGRGGGGGGGGGGRSCRLCAILPANGGGAGGGGGCGGGPGTGGTSGGASFAVVAQESPGLVVADCILESRSGGQGGKGGNGGRGGNGGAGGLGGTGCTLLVGAGGNGGRGGKGGDGGPGRGGTGGPSWCIYAPDVSVANNMYSYGPAGAVGLPGTNPSGNTAPGVAGTAGAVLGVATASWIKLTPARVPPGGQVAVTANVFAAPTSQFKANGVPLIQPALYRWQGVIPAPSAPGSYPVGVDYGTGFLFGPSFEAQRVAGIRSDHAAGISVGDAAAYLFRVWGKVTSRGGNSLDVTDGSGAVVRVTADSALLSGIGVGGFVTASGVLDSQASPPALQAASVQKHAP